MTYDLWGRHCDEILSPDIHTTDARSHDITIDNNYLHQQIFFKHILMYITHAEYTNNIIACNYKQKYCSIQQM